MSEEEEGAEAQRRGRAGLFVPLTSRAFGQRMVTNGAVVPASALQRARAMNAGPSGFSGLPDYALAAAIARMEAEAETLRQRNWRELGRINLSWINLSGSTLGSISSRA